MEYFSLGDKTELFEAILAVVFDEVPAADDSDKASEKSDSSDVFLTHMVSSRILKQLIKTSNQASPSDPGILLFKTIFILIII